MAWQRRRIPEEEKSAEPGKARERAMELLAGREYSSGGLYERLCVRFTAPAAAQAVAELVERGYLDDVRYAEARAHSLLNARKSRRAAAQTLHHSGVSRRIAAEAIAQTYAPDENQNPELEAAQALVRTHYRRKLEQGREDLVRAALLRRGFSYATVRSALQAERSL